MLRPRRSLNQVRALRELNQADKVSPLELGERSPLGRPDDG
jgi:hypothetical protein